MNERQLLAELKGLRGPTAGNRPAGDQALLVLWLLANFVEVGARDCLYGEAERPLTTLIKKYAPSASPATDVAARPFVALKRSLWHAFEETGTPILATPKRSGSWLKARGARGTLSSDFVDLINTPRTLFEAVDVLLHEHFASEMGKQLRDELNLTLRVPASSSPLRKSPPAPVRQIRLSLGEDEPPLKPLRLPDDFASFDHDTRLRWKVFVWLTDVIREKGRRLPARDLKGFSFEGNDLQLIDQAGIWKPADLTSPLSIRTTYTAPNKTRPYDDEEGPDGLIRYKYRGTNPNFFSNVALRRAMNDKRPLIWFKAVAKSVYEPYFPFWVIQDEPEHLQVAGSFTPPPSIDSAWNELVQQT